MKKVIIATLLFTMLHSCMGCSDSQSDMEPIPVPQEEYMASDMVIYEANPRIFAEENAFSAIKAELDRIQSLGTTVLWLMPVNEPGVLKSVNSPYCIKDYKKLNTRYGTKKDLKELVDAAHAKGMKVIGLTGAKSSKLEQMSNVCIKVPQTETYMIQELHLPVYHCLCLMLEEKFFGEGKK